ncbi:MAG: ribonuclease R [Planctomycetes bacterium]|nr:ribonuclease R [Planctomycetota bacterium]
MKNNEDLSRLILEEMKKPTYSPSRTKELARSLGIPKNDYPAFRDFLKSMGGRKLITRGKGNRWALPGNEQRITGRISITRSGSGFLIPDDTTIDDIFIPEEQIGAALNGDHVAVVMEKERGTSLRHYGRVVEVIERGSPRIVAFITKDGKARPEDPKNPYDYEVITEGEEKELPYDHKVILEITCWPGEGGEPAGKVLDILGPSGEPSTEIAAILANFEAPGPFPDEVKEEVRNLVRKLTDEEMAERMDLRDLITCTIDPKTARDFDDALSYQVKEDGTLVVGVHIADVSHFVRPGTELDKESRERSTSIYLPGRVIPMLPEELSNDLCSLRPGEDHLTKTVFIHYSPEGERIKYEIHRSIINSKRRFTYEEVYALITQKEAADNFEEKDILAAVEGLHSLAMKLRKRRLDNGSIELNMPEFQVLMDENDLAVDIALIEHDSSHQLVEEFMLAANVALAEWCKNNGMPVLYRAHEHPSEENVGELAEFLNASGYPFKPPLNRKRLNGVIEKCKGKPEEHSINLAILKSFMRAIYSEDPDIGHFALNFPNYMHFTSPIRRYPDLHLHQMMDAVFSRGADKLPKKLHKLPKEGGAEIVKLGGHTSSMERRAMKIEEAVKDFRRLELLSKQEQREFRAIVTGVRKFGIFVEIENYFVEGMIPRWMLEKKGFSTREEIPSQMKKDHRRHPSHQKPGFHLGQEVKVKITSIDLKARLCEMEFIGTL